MSFCQVFALALFVAVCPGCARPAGTFEGRCSKNPDPSSLSQVQMLALRDAAARSMEACISSGMDCSRSVQQIADGNIVIFIEVANWIDETDTCEGILGSLAAYQYGVDGKFEREILAI